MSNADTVLATQAEKAIRKKNERLEIKCNLSLPLTRIVNRTKNTCGGFRWSEDTRIVLGACIEGIGAGIMLQSVAMTPSSSKSLSPNILVKALMSDPVAQKLFKNSVFNVIKKKVKRASKPTDEQKAKKKAQEKKIKKKAKKALATEATQVV